MSGIRCTRLTWVLLLAALSLTATLRAADLPAAVDFGRDIKPILSNTCFKCHGPDAAQRKGGTKDHRLRLDTEEGAFASYEGVVPIVPGKTDQGEVLARITSKDPDDLMPPAKSGKTLTETQIALIKKWIAQGAKYSKQWSYVKPVRPAVPNVNDKAWPRNPIDAFILSRLEAEGIAPQPEADRYTLIRRLSLDVTGLPPTVEEVGRFAADDRPDAYDRLVDELLARPAYGEHWARMWLDLARYADSSGYASDTPRTIWAYRDYVINSFNANKPFDQFTIEQIAGDLLPNPTREETIATAFHRNTMTNTEGGTTREEFRNAAIIDRVNTTMAVWMGTSMACAQCHDHKYDPLPQKDYFRLFAILNNTEDADRSDEEPTLKFFTPEQEQRKSSLREQIETLKQTVNSATPELAAGQRKWEEAFPLDLQWQPLKAASAQAKLGTTLSVRDDGSVAAEKPGNADTYSVDLPIDEKQLTAVRIEALPPEDAAASGGFLVSRVAAEVVPAEGTRPVGRYVRVELPGRQVYLALSEVQVFNGADNLALRGKASQVSTGYGGDASRAIDGNTDGDFYKAMSTSHTSAADDPWWEVDLGASTPVDRVVVWNRTDGVGDRLKNARVLLLDERRQVMWSTQLAEAPSPSVILPTGGARPVEFAAALADSGQSPAQLETVIHAAGGKRAADAGWSVLHLDKQPHALTLLARKPADVPRGSVLRLTIEQTSRGDAGGLAHFRVSATEDSRVEQLVKTPPDVVAALAVATESRTNDQRDAISHHYVQNVAPELKTTREKLASLTAQLEAVKPASVPVMRELTGNSRRHTFIEFRGNYLSLGDEVQPGVPDAFGFPPSGETPDRLALARWLVSPDNPLTARVIANRYWEQIFGIGIVRTSEEFGSQGEPPSHPELLDWLATELVAGKWDLKRFVKLLVTSAAYRQSSKVTPELLERDPDNRLLAHGPRFRMSAEMVRDQALAVSGLLSPKMFGPSVRPPRPAAGLSAAFGGGLDWATSDGQDKYRRALYTEARRTSPYPSMATFDLPSREICTLRRARTNTPLQALVTLNDPVYVEAAQALARRMIAAGPDARERIRFGFRACVSRPPRDAEVDRLLALYDQAKESLGSDPKKAGDLATVPLGPLPQGVETVDAAAWTAVANVLLNLDETLMKR
jgi:cytochrome c553